MIDAGAAVSSTNSLVNQADTGGLPSRIFQAIKTASNKTGVDFSYLLNKASQESGFDPNAKASTSSATGLFQFTSQTWLQMVKQHGAEYGLSGYASHISTDSTGAEHVDSAAMKQAILNLRKDPTVSAEMAGELDKDNASSLEANVGGKIGGTELYLAHFLGAGGASDFLNRMRQNPNAKGADVLPDAAASNQAVFYTDSGAPRSLQQIYQHFAQKFNNAAAPTMVASAQAAPGTAITAQSIANPGSIGTAASMYTVASNTIPANYSYARAASTAAGGNETPGSMVAAMIMAQSNMGDLAASILSDTHDHSSKINETYGSSIG